MLVPRTRFVIVRIFVGSLVSSANTAVPASSAPKTNCRHVVYYDTSIPSERRESPCTPFPLPKPKCFVSLSAELQVHDQCPSSGSDDDCTTNAASPEEVGCEVTSVAGRIGSSYAARLTGPEAVSGTVEPAGGGLFAAEYVGPVAGEYELEVRMYTYLKGSDDGRASGIFEGAGRCLRRIIFNTCSFRSFSHDLVSPDNHAPWFWACCSRTLVLLRYCVHSWLLTTLEKVSEAKGFGLLGEYFNNRWTFGDPVVTRVDAKVDFSWSDTETITPTGQDYISVR